MPTAGDQLPGGASELMRRIVALEREVRELRAARRLESSSIGTQGALRVVSDDGDFLAYIGQISPTHPDGSQQVGVLLSREDGSVALLLNTFDAKPQSIKLLDRFGNYVVSDDVTSAGGGLARPFLDIPLYPSRNADFLSTASGTFDTLWRGVTNQQNPALHVSLWGTGSTSGTTGEVRVMINGAQFGTTQTVSNPTVTPWNIGPQTLVSSHMDSLTIEVQARRTAGTGNVQVGVRRVIGWEAY